MVGHSVRHLSLRIVRAPFRCLSQATKINGTAVAKELKKTLQTKIEFRTGNPRPPCLATIVVGDDANSHSFVSTKAKACESIGIHVVKQNFPESTSLANLREAILKLNNDSTVDGILVQLPLPLNLDRMLVLSSIRPDKDVDGLHPENLGRLFGGEEFLVPCTPLGCVALLRSANVEITGKNAVVLGRSALVGRPLATLLMHRGATVTVCHSATPDPAALTRSADIVVSAIGQPRMVTGDWLKPGCAVLDVGITYLDLDGKSRPVGDVDFETASQVAGVISPVPGGVGPMTIAMLLQNVVKCWDIHTQAQG